MKNKVIKGGVVYFAIILALLMIINVILLRSNSSLKKDLREFGIKKENELRKHVAREREIILRDLQSKYQADMNSFEALAKRMAIEKQKNQDLQARIEQIKAVQDKK